MTREEFFKKLDETCNSLEEKSNEILDYYNDITNIEEKLYDKKISLEEAVTEFKELEVWFSDYISFYERI